MALKFGSNTLSTTSKSVYFGSYQCTTVKYGSTSVYSYQASTVSWTKCWSGLVEEYDMNWQDAVSSGYSECSGSGYISTTTAKAGTKVQVCGEIRMDTVDEDGNTIESFTQASHDYSSSQTTSTTEITDGSNYIGMSSWSNKTFNYDFYLTSVFFGYALYSPVATITALYSAS